jgi:hypothetical protein
MVDQEEKKMRPADCCRECKYWQEDAVLDRNTKKFKGEGRGPCRYNPPVVFMNEDEEFIYQWPQTHSYDSCHHLEVQTVEDEEDLE